MNKPNLQPIKSLNSKKSIIKSDFVRGLLELEDERERVKEEEK